MGTPAFRARPNESLVAASRSAQIGLVALRGPATNSDTVSVGHQ